MKKKRFKILKYKKEYDKNNTFLKSLEFNLLCEENKSQIQNTINARLKTQMSW